jgi:GT2 family glycosyltransferase
VTPSFSIVIPTFDRPERLSDCLAAVGRLDYPREGFETIVVDDGSSRPVELGPGVRLERQANAGPGPARNRGAAVARGRWLAFTDDDCEPEPDWLRALEVRFAEGADAVVGLTVNALPDNRYATAGQLLSDFLHGYYNRDPADARFGASNNLAVERAAFLAAGGFDETFGRTASEDRELVHRLRVRGNRLAYAPDANVRHRHRQDLRGFWRQHYGYGRGAVAFRERAGAVPLEPLAFYSGLMRSGPPRLAPLLVLTQAANTAGFVHESLRRRLR